MGPALSSLLLFCPTGPHGLFDASVAGSLSPGICKVAHFLPSLLKWHPSLMPVLFPVPKHVSPSDILYIWLIELIYCLSHKETKAPCEWAFFLGAHCCIPRSSTVPGTEVWLMGGKRMEKTMCLGSLGKAQDTTDRQPLRRASLGCPLQWPWVLSTPHSLRRCCAPPPRTRHTADQAAVTQQREGGLQRGTCRGSERGKQSRRASQPELCFVTVQKVRSPFFSFLNLNVKKKKKRQLNHQEKTIRSK